MRPIRIESVESFFTVPLLEALYEDYLCQWAERGYAKDEVGEVDLWLLADQLSPKDFAALPVSFLTWFFDKNDPFPIITAGRVCYECFARTLYEKWLSAHLPRKGE